jgi:hypothetical protein
MMTEQESQRLSELLDALNRCYTDVDTARQLQHEPKAVLRRFAEINRIVCAALNVP